MTVFGGFVGCGQVSPVGTFSGLGKHPCLEITFIFCPWSLSWSGRGEGRCVWPPGRVSRNLASDGHVATSGRFTGAMVEGASLHVTFAQFPRLSK